MPQEFAVDAALSGERDNITVFAGEPVRLTIQTRPSGAEIIATIATDFTSDPVVEQAGTDQIDLDAATLSAVPEGQVCKYNVWLRDGAGMTLLQYGDFQARPSVLPLSVTSDPAPDPLALAGSPAVEATVGTAYSFAPVATGGVTPYVFSLAAGSLPAGLVLNTVSGEIAGVPTGEGISPGLILRVTDDAGEMAELDAFTLTVNAAAPDPLPLPTGIVPTDAATFDDATGWTSFTGGTYDTANGKLVVDGSQSSPVDVKIAVAGGFTSGQDYAAYLRVTGQSAGTIGPRMTGDGFLDAGSASGASRHVMRRFTAAGNYTQFGMTLSPDFAGEVLDAQAYPLHSRLDGPLDIYILAGQSNMVGASATTGFSDDLDLPEMRALAVSGFDAPVQGYETDGSGAAINAALSGSFGLGYPMPLCHPVVHASGNVGGVSPAGTLATRICDTATEAGRTPVFVLAAAGGTDLFTEWDPAGDGRYHDLMVANVDALLARNAANTVRGMVWCQGESSVATGYAAQFKAMIDPLRVSWGAFPIVIMEHGGTPGETGFDSMQAEQQKLATGSGDVSELAACAYVTRPAGAALEADGIHYTGTTNRARGTEAGTVLAGMVS